MLFLGLSLLCVQGATLHIHDIDHKYMQHHFHDSIDSEDNHSHKSNAHLVSDFSHITDHGTVVTEIHVNQSGLLKQTIFDIPAIALIFFFLTFIIPLRCQSNRNWLPCRVSRPTFRYQLAPPLRAPPH